MAATTGRLYGNIDSKFNDVHYFGEYSVKNTLSSRRSSAVANAITTTISTIEKMNFMFSDRFLSFDQQNLPKLQYCHVDNARLTTTVDVNSFKIL